VREVRGGGEERKKGNWGRGRGGYWGLHYRNQKLRKGGV